jgi:hypothetical protein
MGKKVNNGTIIYSPGSHFGTGNVTNTTVVNGKVTKTETKKSGKDKK